MLRIKQLLYEEGFTIAGAKKRLEAEMTGRGATPSSMASDPAVEEAGAPPAPGNTSFYVLFTGSVRVLLR